MFKVSSEVSVSYMVWNSWDMFFFFQCLGFSV